MYLNEKEGKSHIPGQPPFQPAFESIFGRALHHPKYSVWNHPIIPSKRHTPSPEKNHQAPARLQLNPIWCTRSCILSIVR